MIGSPSSTPADDGPVRTGAVPFRDGQTWYRISGPVDDGRPPLLTLHGGPGSVHNYLLPLTELLGRDRAVIFYDQVGCGNSTRRPDWPATAWTVELHLAEMDALVAELGLDRFHLLGHSWGGMLATEYAAAHPERLASLVLCSTAASAQLSLDSIAGLRDALVAEQLAALAGEPDQEELAATVAGLFVTRHICRLTPMPDVLAFTLQQIAENPAINAAMMGQDPAEVVGTLRGWTAEPKLPGLAVPALVLGGEYDELDAAARQPFLDLIPDVRGHVFPDASHTAFLETPAAFRDVVAPFLAAHDGQSAAGFPSGDWPAGRPAL